MDRIRRLNNKFQVLITPHHIYHASFELLRGGWTDGSLAGYQVLEFDNLNDAQTEALRHPSIEWDKLILAHQYAFHNIGNLIQSTLEPYKYNITFEKHIMDRDTLKNTMFNRVINNGNRFTLLNGFNDIISYTIVNPYSENINNISNILSSNSRLRIIKKSVENGVIHIIGANDIGTTYEIGLYPTFLYEYYKWTKTHPNATNNVKSDVLIKAIQSQKMVDAGHTIR